jgi:hypothetical protein
MSGGAISLPGLIRRLSYMPRRRRNDPETDISAINGLYLLWSREKRPLALSKAVTSIEEIGWRDGTGEIIINGIYWVYIKTAALFDLSERGVL